MRVIDPPVQSRRAMAVRDRPRRRCSVALLAATVVVMAWAGRHFYVRAWKGLRHRTADMNTLIAIGTGAAFLYSVVATFAPGLFVAEGARPDVYYEAVIIIIALVLLGNAMEARAKTQRRRAPCGSWRSCSRRPRGCGAMARTWMCRLPTCAAAIS